MSMSGPGSAVGRGGFTRSAGAAAGRGVLLIVFALAIGILLLARALDDDGSSVEAGDSSSTAAPATSAETTPPTPAPTTPTTAALPPAHDPAQVPVLVLNGREIQGVARANNEELLRLGYNGLPPGNTPAAVATIERLLHRPRVPGRRHQHRGRAADPAGPGRAPRRHEPRGRRQRRQGGRRPRPGRPRSASPADGAAGGRAARRRWRRCASAWSRRRCSSTSTAPWPPSSPAPPMPGRCRRRSPR